MSRQRLVPYCNEDHYTLLHAGHRLTPCRQLPPLITQLSGTVTVLPTCAVYIYQINQRFLTRALLDPCSQTTKICKSLITKLRMWTLPVANLEMYEIVVGSSRDVLLTVKVIRKIGLKTSARHLNSCVAEKFTN
ncbi:unnamed protein product, partial [Ceratitis capitata]